LSANFSLLSDLTTFPAFELLQIRTASLLINCFPQLRGSARKTL